jgi:hypothetical protein
MAIDSQYLIHPPRLSVPSMFLIPIGHSRSVGLISSLWAVRMSIQFSLALLLMSAFSSIIPWHVMKSKDNQEDEADGDEFQWCGL